MTTQTATLTGISTVAIAVSDQDATKRVFEELGFKTRFDARRECRLPLDRNGFARWRDHAERGRKH